MRGGGKESYVVPTHEDGNVLKTKYLHELEDSIKARTPLAGDGISIVRTDLGSTIKISTATTCQILDFNVCSNGLPDKISVLCVVTKPGVENLYDNDIPISYAPINTVA
jgi:hypothetical protein